MHTQRKLPNIVLNLRIVLPPCLEKYQRLWSLYVLELYNTIDPQIMSCEKKETCSRAHLTI